MAKVGNVTVEIRPTVTLESAVACVMMLNLFLADNEDCRLEVGDGGKWHLIDEPLATTPGGTCNIPLSNDDKEILDDMPHLRKLFENMGARFS